MNDIHERLWGKLHRDFTREIAKLQVAVNAINKPQGKIIAAASYEYGLCLSGLIRASKNGDKQMFDRWCKAMHRVVPEIADHPSEFYLRALAEATA